MNLDIFVCIVLETAIPTVPSQACGFTYGHYNDLRIAKFSCAHDDECESIVDEECDQKGPYRACGLQTGIGSTCSGSPGKEEGMW